MNLVLHGIIIPGKLPRYFKLQLHDRYPAKASNHFDIILANPPFKGSLDFEDVNPELLRIVKKKKTELLFLAHFENAKPEDVQPHRA